MVSEMLTVQARAMVTMAKALEAHGHHVSGSFDGLNVHRLLVAARPASAIFGFAKAA